MHCEGINWDSSAVDEIDRLDVGLIYVYVEIIVH